MRKLVICTVWVLCAGLLLLQSPAAAGPKKGRGYYESRGEVVWEVPTEEKVIALTFDDGPDPADTPQILDLLHQYGAKATFFVIGNKVERYPAIVKRELDEGHELANHTYSHTYFGKNVSATKLKQDLIRTENVVFAATGQNCHLFRPPGGFYNDTLIHTAREGGYTVVMWSWHQDTKDWNTPGVQKIINKVLNNTRNGDIVLFHDYVEGKTQTIEALKTILPELQQRGYRFVTVSELLTYSKLEAVEK
ncbi:polysaccharide deacetylase family protein [Paenibacillus cremeus]|uniref:Polysaccharide deacetylase family protein n=1 Tax=Paenibacillus cremeus TaxID=2163881 RepID=A0A559K420_9BACL|nr:polysaccharide deacetylase family protein [Paenibacillus cremeus]TVY06879.1 polysaccharide deacetylase family protein [Paenibacillus cremeus]